MDATTINAFDAIVLVILLFSAIVSFTKGFTSEALTLASWAGAIAITMVGAGYLFPYIYEYVKPEWAAKGISYIVLGLISLMLLKTAAGIIGDFVKDSAIGFLDRTLGALFGLVRGLLMISFVHLLTSSFISKSNYPEFFKEAKSRPLIEYGSEMLNNINPMKDDMDLKDPMKKFDALQKLKDLGSSFPSSDTENSNYKDNERSKLNDLMAKAAETSRKEK